MAQCATVCLFFGCSCHNCTVQKIIKFSFYVASFAAYIVLIRGSSYLKGFYYNLNQKLSNCAGRLNHTVMCRIIQALMPNIQF
jgi:hypothetical protein